MDPDYLRAAGEYSSRADERQRGGIYPVPARPRKSWLRWFVPLVVVLAIVGWIVLYISFHK